MMKMIVIVSLIAVGYACTTCGDYDTNDDTSTYEPEPMSSNEPAPCSSDLYHVGGKCGGADHGYLRCEKGLFCSQNGFCGSTQEYQDNAICDEETRDDPEIKLYDSSPDDDVNDDDGDDDEPQPCSSTLYHRMGKCGAAYHGYLRCPQGYACSQYGYCGTTQEYTENALCPIEDRADPDADSIKYGFSPDDEPEMYEPQDDTEGDFLDSMRDMTTEFCSRDPEAPFHRWGKCGTEAHGHFRCRYGQWCNKYGYCSKFAGAADGALCSRETMPNPMVINYQPAPDDDPNYVPPVFTTPMPTSSAITTTPMPTSAAITTTPMATSSAASTTMMPTSSANFTTPMSTTSALE